MNGSTDRLSNNYTGCYIHGKCIHHIMYADDIFLVAPRVTAMQNLFDVPHNFGTVNDILMKPLKSFLIVY